jgi:hypothetical protein
MKNQDAETSVENRVPVEPIIISLEETSEEESDLDDCPVAVALMNKQSSIHPGCCSL